MTYGEGWVSCLKMREQGRTVCHKTGKEVLV